MALVPEDWRRQGLVLQHSIEANIELPILRRLGTIFVDAAKSCRRTARQTAMIANGRRETFVRRRAKSICRSAQWPVGSVTTAMAIAWGGLPGVAIRGDDGDRCGCINGFL